MLFFLPISIIAINIGFEKTEFTVVESVGMLEVYVSVTNPLANQKLLASIHLVIQTISINASKIAIIVK